MRPKVILLTLLCAAFAVVAKAQFSPNEFWNYAQSSLIVQQHVFPQEKIHLHTDKPAYVSGEKVWLRAYVVDAYSHMPFDFSRYVYLELVDPLNKVVDRVIICNLEEGCFGHFPLPEDLPEGMYILRAYTNFMRNLDEGYFCRTPIYVASPLSKDMAATLSVSYKSPDKVDGSLDFTFLNPDKVFDPADLNLEFNGRPVGGVGGEGNTAVFSLKVASKESGPQVLYMNYMGYEKYFNVPYQDYAYDVAFYPEGGYLVPGGNCRLAFKALKPDGSSENVRGQVIDSKDKVVASFSTYHQGMGWIDFKPKAGETYRAECENTLGAALDFNLPELTPEATCLRVDRDGERFIVSINGAQNVKKDDKLRLLIHCRGDVLYADSWDKPSKTKIFQYDSFPSGVIQVLLLDGNYNILSERLVFADNGLDNLPVEVAPDKESYSIREAVKLSISLPDMGGSEVLSSMSVSVTDDSDVIQDRASSIKSALLLDSELRGYIADPDYYFSEADVNKRKASLDLLMLTHGWRRYDMQRVMTGDFAFADIPLEVGQEISGTVTMPGRKKVLANATVNLIAPSRNFVHTVTTDSLGRFHLHNFEFPDRTEYVVQALNERGKPRAEVGVDPMTFSVPYEKMPPALENIHIERDYIDKADKMFIMENGIRMINIDKIQVTAKRRDRLEVTGIYSHLADNSFTEEKMAMIDATSLFEILRLVPGVQIKSVKGRHSIVEKAFIRSPISLRKDEMATTTVHVSDPKPTYINGKFNPQSLNNQDNQVILLKDENKDNYLGPDDDNSASICIDGVMMDQDFDLKDVNLSEVARVDVFRNSGSAIMFGSKGRSGVISITTKRGNSRPPEYEGRMNVMKIVPQSFQEPVEFYSPKYDTPEKRASSIPDLRTTIYWKPDLTAGEGGTATAQFYTSDTPTTYSVVVEGITEDGRTISGRGTVNVK